MGNLNRVKQHVLPIARAESQPSQKLNKPWVQPNNSKIIRGSFSCFSHLRIYFRLRFGNFFLNARRLYSHVFDKPLQSYFGNVPSHWVKPRDDNGFGSFVYNNLNSPGAFPRPHISSFFSNDLPFNVFGRKRQGGGGEFLGLGNSAFLNSVRDYFFCPLRKAVLSFCFKLLNALHYFLPVLILNSFVELI